MKSKYLLVFIVLCYSNALFTQALNVRKVLIVGNSIMFYNKMPQVLEKMLNESNEVFVVKDVSKGGSSLTRSLNTYYVTDKKGFDVRYETDSVSSIDVVLREGWDYVILQEQNQFLLYDQLFKYVTDNTLVKYVDLIKKYNSDCKILLYENYASKKLYSGPILAKHIPVWLDSNDVENVPDSLLIEGMADNSYRLTCTVGEIHSLEEEQDIYYSAIHKTSAINDFTMAATGQIHLKIRGKYSSWKMYRIASHPSKKASFMFACVYYEMITGNSASEIQYTGKVSKKKAKIIKEMVHSYLSEHPVN